MAPRPTGQIIERDSRNGTVYALRFRAYGRRHLVTLGSAADGWSRRRAEDELRHVLADVERGLWSPAAIRPTTTTPAGPTFHEFASEWLEDRRPELAENSILDYTWQLTHHLLPFFHRHQVAHITVAEVDRYRAFKVREGKRSPESINKTITCLGQILAVAEERDLIPRNPVRVNTRKPQAEDQTQAPGLPRHGRADHGAARCRHRPRRPQGGAHVRPARVHGHAHVRRAADPRGRRPEMGRRRPRSRADHGRRTRRRRPAVLQDELTAHRATAERTGRDVRVRLPDLDR